MNNDRAHKNQLSKPQNRSLFIKPHTAILEQKICHYLIQGNDRGQDKISMAKMFAGVTNGVQKRTEIIALILQALCFLLYPVKHLTEVARIIDLRNI